MAREGRGTMKYLSSEAASDLMFATTAASAIGTAIAVVQYTGRTALLLPTALLGWVLMSLRELSKTG